MEFSEPRADAPKRRTFLGANSPSGFISKFDQLADADDGWRLFVIKGGPGSGKSTLIRRVAAELENAGIDAEYIHCSSDADSLDGAIFPEIKCAVADGTPPHAIEPRYPGAFESLICLNDCWNEDILIAAREQIMALGSDIAACHRRCCRYLAAAAMLQNEIYQLAAAFTDAAKIERCAKGIFSREFPHRQKRAPGREQLRFLSAVTNKGRVFFGETVAKTCDRAYLIDDEWGVSSRLLLIKLRALALCSGFDVISSYCPLSPYDRLEHLMIPELRLGFFTGNSRHTFDPHKLPSLAVHVIHAARFTDMESLRRKRQRIAFTSKMSSRLISEAEEQLALAKKLHDELEKYYVSATDFDAVRLKGDALTEKLLAAARRASR